MQLAVRFAAGTGAGLVVALLVSTGAGLVLGTSVLVGPSPQEQAAGVLRRDAADLAQLSRATGDAGTVDELRTTGRRAEDVRGKLRARTLELGAIEDPQARGLALRAHGEVTRVVTGWAELADLSEDDLEPWTQTADDVLRATNDLRAGTAAQVASLTPDAPVRLDHETARKATLGAARYLRASARKLEAWRRDVRAYRVDLENARAEGQEYRGAVLAQIGAYNETRDALQEYVDDAQAFDEDVDMFRDELQAAQSERQEIRSQLAALSGSAPRAARDVHQRLELVLDTAIAATEVGIDLADETEELRDEGDTFTSGFDLPEYDEFVDRSEQITAERDAAVAEWQEVVDRYLERLGGDEPERPAV